MTRSKKYIYKTEDAKLTAYPGCKNPVTKLIIMMVPLSFILNNKREYLEFGGLVAGKSLFSLVFIFSVFI